jgi:hypothetical protein
MNHRNALAKVVAVASAMLLVGGFICYRIGAFEWLERPSSASSSSIVDSSPADADNKEPVLFGGTKDALLP